MWLSCNLFVTSKNETMNSPIHEFKVLHKGLLKLPFNGVSFLLCYVKKRSKPYFFIMKALNDNLQYFKIVNWWIHGFGFLMWSTGYASLSKKCLRNPELYGIPDPLTTLQNDPTLVKRRHELVHSASTLLSRSNMIRYDKLSGTL